MRIGAEERNYLLVALQHSVRDRNVHVSLWQNLNSPELLHIDLTLRQIPSSFRLSVPAGAKLEDIEALFAQAISDFQDRVKAFNFLTVEAQPKL